MEFKEAVTLYLGRGDAAQTFWNFYIAVALGIGGLVAGVKTNLRPAIRALLTVAFLAFAATNYSALRQLKLQQTELADLAKAIAPPMPQTVELSKLLPITTPNQVLAFHLLADALVIAVIWLFPRPQTAA